MRHQIFIFGYYGWMNSGDDAMLYAILQEIHSKIPECMFAIVSPKKVFVPPEAKDRTYYVKPSIIGAGIAILKSSVFVIGGGTHLFDYGKKIKVVKMLLRLFLLVLYAKILGKSVWILGNGIGPLETYWGTLLSRSICLMADYINVRDKESYGYLLEWGFEKKSSLTFDLSVLIEFLKTKKCKSNDNQKRILGVSITPVFEIYYGSNDKDIFFVEEMSKCINDLLEQELISEVRLFVFHGGSLDDDFSITKLLEKKLDAKNKVKFIDYDPDPRNLMTKVGQCDLFIGTKYHSCVFAYINRIPLLIIDYHPKCRAFADEIKLPKYAIISLDGILKGSLGIYFQNLNKNSSQFVGILPIEIAKKRARISFNLLNSQGGINKNIND